MKYMKNGWKLNDWHVILMLQEKNVKVYEDSKILFQFSLSLIFIWINRITKYASQEKSMIKPILPHHEYAVDSETNSISPIPYQQGEK